MLNRQAIWTYISVTTVAVLIWMWAAGATRTQQMLPAQLQFTPVGDAAVRWIVNPSRQGVKIELEGSRWSLQKATELLRTPLAIDLISEVGAQTKDLLTELNRNERLRETGVKVLSCDPPEVLVLVDRRERITIPVRANLSGVQTIGEVEIDPDEVTVSLPSLERQRIGQITAETAPLMSQLRDLAPGVKHTLVVNVRLPEVTASRDVIVEPSAVKVSLTIRSRTEEATLPSVRVQLAGAYQDFDEYIIEMDDTLREVTISGDADLIRRVLSGESRVIALIHLTTNEKERGIQSKRISGFVVINPDNTMAVVSGRVNGQTELPEIPLRISKRSVGPPTPAPGALGPVGDSSPGS